MCLDTDYLAVFYKLLLCLLLFCFWKLITSLFK